VLLLCELSRSCVGSIDGLLPPLRAEPDDVGEARGDVATVAVGSAEVLTEELRCGEDCDREPPRGGATNKEGVPVVEV